MRIDHLVYAVRDLGAAVNDLEGRFGLRAAIGGQHLGLGTHNALLALGPSTYLEIIAPDPGQPAPKARRPFGIDDLTEPRLAGWAVACDDIDAAIAGARSRGFDPGDAIAMERVGGTDVVLRWRLTVNAIDGGPVPFLIDWGSTDHPARSAPSGLTLDGFEIEHPDVAGLTATFQALDLDVSVTAAARTALVAHLRGPNGEHDLR